MHKRSWKSAPNPQGKEKSVCVTPGASRQDVGGHNIHMLFGEFPTVLLFYCTVGCGREGRDIIRYDMWYNSLNDASVPITRGEDRFSATETSMLLSLPQMSSVLYLASL